MIDKSPWLALLLISVGAIREAVLLFRQQLRYRGLSVLLRSDRKFARVLEGSRRGDYVEIHFDAEMSADETAVAAEKS